MKLLLCKNIEKLGIVGDVVNVRPGYARNYLLPQGLATEPTEANIRALAEARRQAELERAKRRVELEALAERMKDVEVTIKARANEDGHLYGSVGQREIAAALMEEGFAVDPDAIRLLRPIRHLDNVAVDIRLGEDLTGSVKVWVVREKLEGEADDAEMDDAEEAEEVEVDAKAAGMEAGPDDDSANE